MIDKVFPRKLNSSKDARVRGKDEMIDAVNVTIDDNYDESKNDGGTGNFGVLKPLKGNQAVPNDSLDFNGNGRVIGSCVDDRNNKIYYFLFSTTKAEQGIYEYDADSNKIVKLISSKYFNFRPNSFIQADIVHIPKGESETNFKIRPIIFFTDGHNEPRKVDVSRVTEGQALSDVDSLDFFDFISVCTRTPIDPPTASFQNDPNTKVSNFKGERGFQFAYQNIYKSGDISPLSTYSELYVPSAYINQGTQPNPSFFTENYLGVVIPKSSVGNEVERVRLLVREGNLGNWFVVDDIENDDPSSDITFSFYNDGILSIVPEAEVRRQFNASPKAALSQTITNNRLFFGNYKEGFDIPDIKATITPTYLARPQDFITFDLVLTPEIRNANQNSGYDIQNRMAAYRLDTSNIPATTEANTQVIFNVTLSPDRNFHFYEARKGYHGSTENNILGDDGSTEHVVAQIKSQQVSPDFNEKGSSYFSPNASFAISADANQTPGLTRNGVSQNPYTGSTIQWDAEFVNEEEINVVCGTNAANPFIIQGQPLQFSGSFITRIDLTQQQISDIIADMMIGNYGRNSALFINSTDAAGNSVSIPTVNIVSASNEAQYTINLNIGNLDKLKVHGAPDPRARLVNAVGNRSLLDSVDGTKWIPPCGYFIVNYAKPRFRLRDIRLQYEIESYGNSGDFFFALDLVDLGNFDVMTCVPDVWLGDNQTVVDDFPLSTFSASSSENIFDGWVCMTSSYIKYQLPNVAQGVIQNKFVHNADNIWSIIQDGSTNTAVGTIYVGAAAFGAAISAYAQVPESKAEINNAQIARWLGTLVPADSERVDTSLPDGTFNIEYRGGRIINTYTNFAEDAENTDGIDIYEDRNIFFSYAFSVLDGEAGPGAVDTEGTIAFQHNSSVGYWSVVAGVAPWFDPTADENYFGAIFNAVEVLAELNCMPLIGQTGDLKLSDFTAPSGDAKVEIAAFETLYASQQAGVTSSRSFKRKATHSFGIVFYDQRGRSSDVIPIGSAYVQDYMNSTEQGPVNMNIDLTAYAPPSWAWHYQIVYGGNSTVGDFIQYSAGGAFIEFDPEGNIDDGNIYVSLNYLQNNSNVSYSKAFGVTKYDGNKDFYTYKEGDKLRVISYYTDNTTVQYPPQYEFDVVGTVTLADDDPNPLINPEGSVPKAATGQFVILRNNPNAIGFNYQSIKAGSASGPVIETSSHFWNNRCIFELYSPLKNQEAEDRVYYEVSRKYNVIRDSVSGSYTWENSAITISRGDVYFRRVAVNLPRYDSSFNVFSNIITDNSNNSPRFLDYFLETQTFTDSIIGANQLDWGKPKIVNRYQREIRRDSSITFSDVNNYSSPRLLYTSFDITTSNYKDLPNSHGSIQNIVDRGDSVFVIQEEKSSDIPVSRTLISDAVGSDIVIASEKAIGNQVFYAGDYGCSNNPESVVKIGENIYFANKDKREVYKFNPSNGIAIISEYGMKSYFKSLFDEAVNNELNNLGKARVVGGYDPLQDEFILSVYNQGALSISGDDFIDQDSGVTITDFNPDDFAGITQEELDELLLENANLASQLAEAQLDIGDLQQQIIDLYNQIGDVVNDPTVDVNDVDNIIADLQSEIDEIQGQIDANYGFMASQISQSVNYHRSALLAAKQEIQSSETFISAINDATNPDGVNRFAEGVYLIPDTIDSQFTTPAGTSAGSEVSYDVYLSVVQNIVNTLKDYRETTATPPGLYDETIGSFTDRLGVATTFAIGYGIPTDDSLADADENVLPVGSALYNDQDFLSKLFGGQGPTGTTYIGYLQQAQTMTQFFGLEAIVDQGGRIDFLTDQNYLLELDKQELLGQIAAMIDGIYESRGPAVNKPEILDQFPFGVSYIDPQTGGTVSPFASLKAAIDADSGDTTYSNLEAAILDGDPITKAFIIDAIEKGIFSYRSDYQLEVDGQIDDIEAITATRDSLASTAFGAIQTAYNNKTQLSNGAPPTFKPTGNELSPAMFSLLVGGSATPQQIIAALSGATLDDDGNLVSTVNAINLTGGYLETQFGITADIAALLNTAAGVDTGTTGGGGGLTAELRQNIVDLVTGIESQINDSQVLNFTFPTVASVINDPESTAEEVAAQIGAFAGALLSGSTADEGSLQSQLEQLSNLLFAAADPIIVNQFFDETAYTDTPLNIISDAIAIPKPSLNPTFNQAFSLLEDVNNAISALKDFQALFGSISGGNITLINTGNGPTSSIGIDSSVYGVGYTGLNQTGPGLTAQKLISGDNFAFNGNVYSSYVGLRNALDKIIDRTAEYSANQTPQSGALYAGESYETTLIDFNQQPIFFDGNAADLLNTGTYNSLYSIIEDIVSGGQDPESPAIDPATISSIASTILNSAITNTINNYSKGLSTFVANPSTGQSGYAEFLQSGGENLNLYDGLSTGDGADLDGDGSVGTTDLLAFLADYGSLADSKVFLSDVPANRLDDYADQYRYNTVSNILSIPDTFGQEIFSSVYDSAYINNILNQLTTAFGEFIPDGQSIIFNPVTGQFEISTPV
jgi:hypothetical protein